MLYACDSYCVTSQYVANIGLNCTVKIPAENENACLCCRLALMKEEPGINIENLGDVRWHLCLCLVLAWILVIIFVSRGIQSTGKVITSEY